MPTILSMHSRRKPKRALMSAASWFPLIKCTFSGYSICNVSQKSELNFIQMVAATTKAFQVLVLTLRARSKVCLQAVLASVNIVSQEEIINIPKKVSVLHNRKGKFRVHGRTWPQNNTKTKIVYRKNTHSKTFGSVVSNVHSKEVWSSRATYVMSPAVDGKPYSSKRRIKSPNCPWRSPNTLIGAFNCKTVGSCIKICSAA